MLGDAPAPAPPGDLLSRDGATNSCADEWCDVCCRAVTSGPDVGELALDLRWPTETFVDVAADVVLLLLHQLHQFLGGWEVVGDGVCVEGDVGAEDTGLDVVGVAGGRGVGQRVAGHTAEPAGDVRVGRVAQEFVDEVEGVIGVVGG